jgi:hypothetical protein
MEFLNTFGFRMNLKLNMVAPLIADPNDATAPLCTVGWS